MGHLVNQVYPQYIMEMAILTVKSKMYMFGVFSNIGILILLKINGSRSVNSRRRINVLIKDHLYGFVLFTQMSTPLHYYVPRLMGKVCLPTMSEWSPKTMVVQ